MKRSILLLVVITFYLQPRAQENRYCLSPDPAIFSAVTLNGWIKFQPYSIITSKELFLNYKSAFLLSTGYEMKVTKKITDKIGFTHTWYQEYYNNIPVLFGHFIAHEKNNMLQSGNGKIYTSPRVQQLAGITAADALQKALQFVRADKYWWQDSTKEKKLKKRTGDYTATYYPRPELFYHYDEIADQLRLCYKMIIQAIDPGKSGILYMYADNGKVFLWNPLETSTCDAAVINTVWYNSRTIYTSFSSGWDLQDRCTPSVYSVYDYATPFNDIFHSNNNQWTTDRQRSAATCLWSIRQTRDVYSSVFGRNGHDDNAGNIDMYFDYIFAGGSTYNANYHYDPVGDDEINIGRGNDPVSIQDDFSALDILAHEFTHGVTNYTCDLVYNREPGALNESFSDLFGEFVERVVMNGNDWWMGWDRIESGSNRPLRSLIAPMIYNQPDRYMGSLWSNATSGCDPIGPGEPGNNDYCGVHTNSGVQNRMYYLLSVGGSGWTNNATSSAPGSIGVNPYSWDVSGISIDKAARIAYRVMTAYLSSNSNYFDSRNAWVHAAEDLYGICSFEAIQTGKAWYAVGIGPPASVGSIACGNYGGSPYYLFKAGQINIAPACTVNILTTGNTVQFTSGNKIVISPGFSAPAGSRFIANINNDCAFATY